MKIIHEQLCILKLGWVGVKVFSEFVGLEACN